MYNSSFTQPAFRLEMKDNNKSNGKSCDYYLKIIFFFSSLIQSLIIISLVLFLIYGRPEYSAQEKRVQDLEQSFTNVSQKNMILKEKLKVLNESLEKKIYEKNQCEKKCERCSLLSKCPTLTNMPNPYVKALETKNQQLEYRMKAVEANSTQTVQILKVRLEDVTKARDRLLLDKSRIQNELETYTKMCKEDFAKPLKGIQDVTKAFLSRIESLLPHSTFHLTCTNQQQKIEEIRMNCTSLSKDVEEKFQHYLDDVGKKVADIQSQRYKLKTENDRLTKEVRQCG